MLAFLKESGIIDQVENTSKTSDSFFNLISFRDYPVFNVDNSGINSQFYDELFAKVVKDTDNNPFYQDYVEDKKNHGLHLTHHNYELFNNEKIRSTLKYLLPRFVKLSWKFKKPFVIDF